MNLLKILSTAILFTAHCVVSDETTHEYKVGEAVLVWVNKIGPFNNPSETYPFYGSHVPFCNRASEIQVKHDEFHYHKFDGLGSLLQGNDLTHSGIPIKFAVNESRSLDCTMELNAIKTVNLIGAIAQKYWYQMYIDDLPIWGMVGEFLPLATETSKHRHDNLQHVDDEHIQFQMNSNKQLVGLYPHVFSHKAFSISYNGNRVIEVNLTSEDPVLVRSPPRPTKNNEKIVNEKFEPQSIKLTYSITWIQTDILFHRRFDRYLDFQFFEHQIHWFAIFNSFMLVIFLVGAVTMVLLKALRKDYERIAAESDPDLEYEKVVEETGWKKLHGDVFRNPLYLSVFAAFIGTGYQLYISTLLVILLAISGKLYDTRGTVTTAAVLTYAVTSLVAGYTSSQTFLEYSTIDNKKINKNTNTSNINTAGAHTNINTTATSTSTLNNVGDWKIAMVLTGLMFPSIAFIVCFLLNILSISYAATNAITFLTFLTMICIWVVSIILLFIGTLIGRSTFKGADFPTPVNLNFIRPLPDDRPWYFHPIIFCNCVGILPFGSIFIEMYYIFNSFWNYKFYYVYGFMLLVFLILTIVTICVTIVSTYLLLNSEDRRWKWVSIFSGGSTALYVFCYATFYFITKTQMSGIFQTSFYFGYMFLFSLAIFFICGTIGYVGTSVFVRRIYSNIKIE